MINAMSQVSPDHSIIFIIFISSLIVMYKFQYNKKRSLITNLLSCITDIHINYEKIEFEIINLCIINFDIINTYIILTNDQSIIIYY